MQSGCYTIDGQTLSSFVKGCSRLVPEKLSYCSEIEDGPYFDKANGCLNLDCDERFCCRKLRNYWEIKEVKTLFERKCNSRFGQNLFGVQVNLITMKISCTFCAWISNWLFCFICYPRRDQSSKPICNRSVVVVVGISDMSGYNQVHPFLCFCSFTKFCIVYNFGESVQMVVNLSDIRCCFLIWLKL